jgi:poly(A) polymerase
MRDIWSMQPRFERRVGKAAYKLLEHPRFRAGYDFLLLRCQSGELDMELGDWWTAFYEGDGSEREHLIASLSNAPGGQKRKRAPRRGPRHRNGGEGGEGGDGQASQDTRHSPAAESASDE